MRRIHWKHIKGTGTKPAPLPEKPSQRIALRQAELARSAIWRNWVADVEARVAMPAYASLVGQLDAVPSAAAGVNVTYRRVCRACDGHAGRFILARGSAL